MPQQRTKSHHLRKTPRQARAVRTRQDLLAGATRVLDRLGAANFTTNRVAEATGVSIGSLYQYYPNKAALLADLHVEEAERTWDELAAVLADPSLPARARFEGIVCRAFEAQAAAVQHHVALRAVGVEPLAAPQMSDIEQRITAALARFFAHELPGCGREASVHATFCIEVIFALLDRVARQPERDVRHLAPSIVGVLADHVGFDR